MIVKANLEITYAIPVEFSIDEDDLDVWMHDTGRGNLDDLTEEDLEKYIEDADLREEIDNPHPDYEVRYSEVTDVQM